MNKMMTFIGQKPALINYLCAVIYQSHFNIFPVVNLVSMKPFAFKISSVFASLTIYGLNGRLNYFLLTSLLPEGLCRDHEINKGFLWVNPGRANGR